MLEVWLYLSISCLTSHVHASIGRKYDTTLVLMMHVLYAYMVISLRGRYTSHTPYAYTFFLIMTKGEKNVWMWYDWSLVLNRNLFSWVMYVCCDVTVLNCLLSIISHHLFVIIKKGEIVDLMVLVLLFWWLTNNDVMD